MGCSQSKSAVVENATARPQEYPPSTTSKEVDSIEAAAAVVDTVEAKAAAINEKEDILEIENKDYRVEECVSVEIIPPLSPASPITTVVSDVATPNYSDSALISLQPSPLSHHEHVDDETVSELPFDGDVILEEREAIHSGPFVEPPMKFGWMKKQADHMKTWRQRYIVLYNGYLLYYAKEIPLSGKGKDTKSFSKQFVPRGIICLAGIRERTLYEKSFASDLDNQDSKDSISKTSPNNTTFSKKPQTLTDRINARLNSLDEISIMKGNQLFSSHEESHQIHLIFVPSFIHPKFHRILSPTGSTQGIKELYLQVSSIEEKNSWMEAFSLHTQYIESIASMVTSFPNPVPLLIAHVQTLQPEEGKNEEKKRMLMVPEEGKKKQLLLATTTIKEEKGEDFFDDDEDDDDNVSVMTTTTVGSHNTILSSNTSTVHTNALIDAIYNSSPPHVLTSSSPLSSSSSSTTSPLRARPMFTTSRSLNTAATPSSSTAATTTQSQSRSNSPMSTISSAGSSRSRSNSPIRPLVYHQPSLRHALMVSSSEALGNVKMKIPLKVQQMCPPGEKILLCGMVSTMNRAYVYVIRFIVFLRKDATIIPFSSPADEDDPTSRVENNSSSTAPMILKRVLCLDANSYVTKQEMVWSQPALGVSITQPQQQQQQQQQQQKKTDMQLSIVPTVRVTEEKDSFEIIYENKKYRFYPKDKVTPEEWVQLINHP